MSGRGQAHFSDIREPGSRIQDARKGLYGFPIQAPVQRQTYPLASEGREDQVSQARMATLHVVQEADRPGWRKPRTKLRLLDRSVLYGTID